MQAPASSSKDVVFASSKRSEAGDGDGSRRKTRHEFRVLAALLKGDLPPCDESVKQKDNVKNMKHLMQINEYLVDHTEKIGTNLTLITTYDNLQSLVPAAKKGKKDATAKEFFESSEKDLGTVDKDWLMEWCKQKSTSIIDQPLSALIWKAGVANFRRSISYLTGPLLFIYGGVSFVTCNSCYVQK